MSRPKHNAFKTPRVQRYVARVALFAVLVPLATLPIAGLADDDDRRDQELARKALQEGKILSLRQVLARVENDFPGDPVKIEFEHDDALYIYEIKLLQKNGTIVKLKVDARTGDIISAKSRGHLHKDTD